VKKVKSLPMTCPVCKSINKTFFLTVNSEQSVEHLLKKRDERFYSLQKHVESLWHGNECNIIKCEKCGLVYAFPFVAGDAKYYNLIYTDNTDYEEWKFEYDQTYQELFGTKNRTLKLLEIGAGNGEFVKKISENIIPAENIHCTEYSDYGKKEIENLGIKCFSLDIRDHEFIIKGYKYDIICMFEVLEHLDNLDDLFTKLNLVTNSGSSLFIGVPNNRQRKIYEDGGIIQDMPPVHLTRWNYESMNIIAKKYQWSIQKHKAQPQNFYQNVELFVRTYFQKKLKVSNKIDSINNTFFRKVSKLSVFFYIIIRKCYIIPKLLSRDLGVVQWFYLKKQ
jgi:SAM-dependent methyltransferase